MPVAELETEGFKSDSESDAIVQYSTVQMTFISAWWNNL